MSPNIPDLAEKAIAHIEYGRLGTVITLCLIQMDNGHEVVGQSHCANPASFDEEIGRVKALKVAMGKVEELIAFRLKEESPTNQPEEIPPGE
ncbi:MAG: Gp49 family protein, partial [Alcanivorax sp.]